MTYLEIVRRLARFAGMTSSASIPASVVAQNGNLLDAVDWAADAYTELQTKNPTFRWLRAAFTFNTVDGTDTYTYGDASITRFSRWWVDDLYCPPKAYLTSGGVVGQYFLQYIPWDVFQTIYKIGTPTEGGPVHITIDPTNQLVLGPVPNDEYTITGEYQKSPQVLAADSDEPEMPEEFHMLIVYEALLTYGFSQAAGDVLNLASSRGGALRSALLGNQLPAFRKGRSLA
jgi:hypothetical protein